VQQFAFQIQQWCYDKRNRIESGIFQREIYNDDADTKVQGSDKPMKKYQQMKEGPLFTFENAFYFHFNKIDYKKAEALYEKCIARSLQPWPSFCLLLNIYLKTSRSKVELIKKLDDMKNRYSLYLGIYNYGFQPLLARCYNYAEFMEQDPNWINNQTKNKVQQNMMFGKALDREVEVPYDEVVLAMYTKNDFCNILVNDYGSTQELLKKKRKVL
jgi:hypothetical protein